MTDLLRKAVRNLLRLDPFELVVVAATAALYLPVFGLLRLVRRPDRRAREGGFHAHPGPDH